MFSVFSLFLCAVIVLINVTPLLDTHMRHFYLVYMRTSRDWINYSYSSSYSTDLVVLQLLPLCESSSYQTWSIHFLVNHQPCIKEPTKSAHPTVISLESQINQQIVETKSIIGGELTVNTALAIPARLSKTHFNLVGLEEFPGGAIISLYWLQLIKTSRTSQLIQILD